MDKIRFLLPILFLLFLHGCGSGSWQAEEPQSEVSDNNGLIAVQSVESQLSSSFRAWLAESTTSTSEVIPSPLPLETLDTASETLFLSNGLKIRAALPATFTMQDPNGDANASDSYLSPVRDQGGCGVSWAFATYSALEGSYATVSMRDFSEDHLKHTNGFAPSVQNACRGGNIWMSSAYFARFGGALPESKDPYTDNALSPYCASCEATNYIDNMIVVPSRRSTGDNETIKRILHDKLKPIYAHMEVAADAKAQQNGSVYDAATNSFYQNSAADAKSNHAVVIVGWDDNYEAQGERGAFIVRNSWGPLWGEGGYFYVPYSDQSIGFDMLAYFDDKPENELPFDYLYRHDTYGMNALARTNVSTLYMANVFTIGHRDEWAEAASFFVAQSGTHVTLELHRVTSLEPFVSQNIATVVDAGTFARGFYTVPLLNSPKLGYNDTVAVVLKFSHTENIRMPLELPIASYAPSKTAKAHQGYVASKDVAWIDMHSVGEGYNLPIKLLTRNAETEPFRPVLTIDANTSVPHIFTNVEFTPLATDENGTAFSYNWESYHWDFDDNTASDERKPIHQFTYPGIYTVACTGTDTTGFSQTSYFTITAQGTLPVLEDANGSIIENAPAGTIAAQVGISDIGDTDILSMTLNGSGASLFNISTTGRITLAEGAAMDYESVTAYTLYATARNGQGESNAAKIIINVTNFPEIPPVISSFNTILDENLPSGTLVGTLPIIRIGDTPISAVTLTGNGSTHFQIQPDGNIFVAGSLDYETLPAYTLTAVARNEAGESNSATVSIALNNLPETTPELQGAIFSIDENATAGQTVGVVTILSEGDTAIIDMNLTGTGAENFDISLDGNLSVSATAALDYETVSLYTLNVNAYNSAGESTTVTVTVNITNTPETLPTLADFTAEILEDANTTFIIGTVTVINPGDTNITAFSLSGDGAEKFIISDTGVITLAADNSLNFDLKSVYDLNVTATNLMGESAPASVTINLISVEAQLVTRLIADDGEANDEFGSVVAYSGNFVAAASSHDGNNTGAVYLFQNDGNYQFSALQKIVASDANVSSLFGSSMAMHNYNEDYYLVIGAEGDDNLSDDAGSAYVFRKGGSTFEEKVKLTANPANTGAHFGSSVGVNIPYIAIGAEDDLQRGAVYIYMRNNQFGFDPVDKLLASDALNNDKFGASVSVYGDYIAISAPNRSDINAAAGAVYLFRARNDGSNTFEQIAKLTGSLNETDSRYGSDVALTDGRLAVGAPGNGYNNDKAGYVYIYNISGTTVTEHAVITPPDAKADDGFGNSIAIDGAYLVIGAANTDTVQGTVKDAGMVYLYKDINNAYKLVSKLEKPAPAAQDYFGNDVALDANYKSIVIGTALEEVDAIDDAGAAYIIELDP